MAGVAQLVRASGCGSEGRGFDSRRLPHLVCKETYRWIQSPHLFPIDSVTQFMDILFFAALAFYIFFKLNKQLGKIDDEEKRHIAEKLAQKRKEFLELQGQASTSPQMKVLSGFNVKKKDERIDYLKDEKIIGQLDEATKQNFLNVLQASGISAEFFLNGAKSAFEMVIKAFANGDLQVLKFLLAEKIYQGFESAINKRNFEQNALTTNLISIEKSEVVSAMLFGNTASVVVKFISQQINYVSDKNGHIIEGKKDEISQVTDIWTFKKEVTSSDPNWVICVTSNS